MLEPRRLCDTLSLRRLLPVLPLRPTENVFEADAHSPTVPAGGRPRTRDFMKCLIPIYCTVIRTSGC